MLQLYSSSSLYIVDFGSMTTDFWSTKICLATPTFRMDRLYIIVGNSSRNIVPNCFPTAHIPSSVGEPFIERVFLSLELLLGGQA